MGKVLVIAEKPDAGRNMAKVLKCDNCKDGYIENEKYIVTWAVGHLIGLKMPEEHNPALKEWKISTLPLIFDIDDSLKVLPDTKKQFEIVKKLIHRPDVDYLINAGDAGREGYLIQSWIYRYAGNRKPVKILWANSTALLAVEFRLLWIRYIKDLSILAYTASGKSGGIFYFQLIKIFRNKLFYLLVPFHYEIQ